MVWSLLKLHLCLILTEQQDTLHDLTVHMWRLSALKKKLVTWFIHHLFVMLEERAAVPNDSIVKQ